MDRSNRRSRLFSALQGPEDGCPATLHELAGAGPLPRTRLVVRAGRTQLSPGLWLSNRGRTQICHRSYLSNLQEFVGGRLKPIAGGLSVLNVIRHKKGGM